MKIFIAIALLSLSFSLKAQPLAEITWMSEQYAPFNYQDKEGRPKGIAVDLLIRAAANLDWRLQPENITFMPWARSYRILKDRKNTALFIMGKTANRLPYFHFVGPISHMRISVIAAKSRALDISSVEDLSQLSVGVVRDDIGHHLLTDLGVDEGAMVYASYADQLIRMLDTGRIDAIAYVEDVAYWNMAHLGIASSQYHSVFLLLEDSFWYAFNKDSDPAVLKVFQQELDRLKALGVVESLRFQYLDNPN